MYIFYGVNCFGKVTKKYISEINDLIEGSFYTKKKTLLKKSLAKFFFYFFMKIIN